MPSNNDDDTMSPVDNEDGETHDYPPGNTLQRRQLQQQLKKWKVLATGTTAALLERYDDERSKRCKVNHESATASSSPPAAASATVAVAASSQAANSSSTNNEKRLRPFRSSCPDGVWPRIARAKTQRMYLVHRSAIENNQCEFAVLGSTGNIYNVTMKHLPKCTCPDFTRGHNHLCKHILFVMLKVMAIDENSPYLYQAAWLTSELQDMFTRFIELRGPSADSDTAFLANDRVRQAYAKIQAGESLADEEPAEEEKNSNGVVRKTLSEDDCDCPICFDSMMGDAPAKLTYCRTACGYNFHVDCIQRWCQLQQKSSGSATCPNCRQPWEVKGKSTGDKEDEGYTNLGQLQGQSPARDTSTYSGWYDRKRRRS